MDDPKFSIQPLKTESEILTCASLMAGTDPWITLGIDAAQVEKSLRDPFYESYVAYAGEEIVGVAVIQMQGAFSGYLKSIAVKDTWRSRHVGSRLMDFIEGRIFSIHPNVFLCVSSFNQGARLFYLKRGYRETGILKDYLVRGYDEVMMRKTIGSILPST